jgi:periplasmic divalent cation tolerance protein
MTDMERMVFVYTTYPSIVEAEAVRAEVKARHSYQTPAILVLPIESVDQTYLAWLTAETEQSNSGGQ